MPSLPIDLDACVAAIVLVHADLLFPPHTSRTKAVFFGDADVLTRVAVVSTGWRGSQVGSVHTIPSSALDSRSLFSLVGDFGSRRLGVLVRTREDAERDTRASLVWNTLSRLLLQLSPNGYSRDAGVEIQLYGLPPVCRRRSRSCWRALGDDGDGEGGEMRAETAESCRACRCCERAPIGGQSRVRKGGGGGEM